MIDWVLILGFLATTVGGFIVKKGLVWGERKLKTLLGIEVERRTPTAAQASDLQRLSELLSIHAAGFKKHFDREFKKWRATLGKDEQEVLKQLQDAVDRLEILPDEVRTIVQKAISAPVPLFITLEKFLEHKDVELRETKVYVPRADELEVLDKFLDSDKRLLLIHGERGVGKTRLLIEYARKFNKMKKAYRFCSKRGTPTDREYATAVEEVGKKKELVILLDEIESVPNLKMLLDFLIDPSRLDIKGDLRIIGCTVYPDTVKRDDLRSWTQVYELGKFEDPKGLEEIARKNFPEDAEKVDLGLVAKLSEGFPDAVIALFNLLEEGAISWAELPNRYEILTRRFNKLYDEAGEHAPALAILAAIQAVWDEELDRFDRFYSKYAQGTFESALNHRRILPHVAHLEDSEVRLFRPRELVALHGVRRFFFDPDGVGDLKALARVVAKTRSAPSFVERILTFQDNEECKERCDKAILKLLEAIQGPRSHTEALFSVLNTIDDRYSRRGILHDKVDWKSLKSRLQELTEPADRALWGHNMGMILQNLGEPLQAKSWYEESLEIKKELGNKSGIAKSLHQLGMIAQAQGDYKEAKRLYEESLEIKKEIGDKSGIASTLHQLGNVAYLQGDYKEARKLYEESLEIEKELGDKSGIAISLHQLGMIAQKQGDYDEARKLYEESLEIAKELGDKSGIAQTLHQLGNIAYSQGDYDEARKLYQKSLEIEKELGNKSGIAATLHQLGMIAQDQGDYDEARKLYQEAKSVFEELVEKAHVAAVLHQLGNIAYSQGNYDVARKLYQESLEIKKELGDKFGIAVTLGQLGRLAERDGNELEAFIYYLQALSIFAELKAPEAKLALSDIARLRDRVGSEEFKRIVEEAGKELGKDLSYVLKWFEPKD